MVNGLKPIKIIIFILAVIVLIINVFFSDDLESRIATSIIAIVMIILVFIPEKNS